MRKIIFLTEATAETKDALARMGAERAAGGYKQSTHTEKAMKARPEAAKERMQPGDSSRIGSFMAGKQAGELVRKLGKDHPETLAAIERGKKAKDELRDNHARSEAAGAEKGEILPSKMNTYRADSVTREGWRLRNKYGVKGTV